MGCLLSKPSSCSDSARIQAYKDAKKPDTAIGSALGRKGSNLSRRSQQNDEPDINDFWQNGAPDQMHWDTDTSEEFESDSSRRPESRVHEMPSPTVAREISNCDSVRLKQHIHVYRQNDDATYSKQNSRAGTLTRKDRTASGTETVEELERQVQDLRAEKKELYHRYDNAAKTLTLEKEVMTQKHENSLCDLKRESEAQRARHKWMMTQLEQERTLLSVKHENTMQELGQREAIRRCEHEQLLSDLRQKEERLQAQSESDQRTMFKKIADLNENQEIAVVELHRKEQELGRKEEELSVQKEEELRWLEDERRHLMDEHRRAMCSLEQEKQELEDTYRRKVSELEAKERSLYSEYDHRLATIEEERKQEKLNYQKYINDLNQKEREMALNYATARESLFRNQQDALKSHENDKNQYREKKRQLVAKLDELMNEIVYKDVKIKELERRLAAPRKQKWTLEETVNYLEDQLITITRAFQDQRNMRQQSKVSSRIVERKCDLVARVHRLFEEVLIRSMVDRSDRQSDFEEQLNRLLDSLSEVLIGGPVVDKFHEQTKKELDLIRVIVKEFGSPASQRLVRTMTEVLADKRRHDYARWADEYEESNSRCQSVEACKTRESAYLVTSDDCSTSASHGDDEYIDDDDVDDDNCAPPLTGLYEAGTEDEIVV